MEFLCTAKGKSSPRLSGEGVAAGNTTGGQSNNWLLLWLSILAFSQNSRSLKIAKKSRSTHVKLQY